MAAPGSTAQIRVVQFLNSTATLASCMGGKAENSVAAAQAVLLPAYLTPSNGLAVGLVLTNTLTWDLPPISELYGPVWRAKTANIDLCWGDRSCYAVLQRSRS